MTQFFVGAYLTLGFVAAVITMKVFPPMEGFRPSIILRLAAVAVFAVLWPVLLSLAIWYLAMGYLERNRKAVRENVSVERIVPDPIPRLQGTKPR